MTSPQNAQDPPRSDGQGPHGRLVAGRYRLEKRLGAGATGTVYRALDERGGAAVAVKLLHTELLERGEVVRRFRREGHRAPALVHPHLAALLDSGEDADGTPFVVLELLEGRTLADELRPGGDLSFERSTHIVLQVLEAIGHAHRHGLLHRDLKPSNIMLVERDGQRDFVKVCDFGLLKVVAGGPDAPPRSESTLSTGLGALCGTPEYMSPEQARAEALDRRSDLYAIGVVLYQLLTGQLPFRAPSPMGVLTRQITELPQPPSARRRDRAIPRRLEALVLRALAKDPRERPQSAEAFAEELRALERIGWERLTPAAVDTAEPASTIVTLLPEQRPPATGGRRRRRRALWLGGAVVVLAAALTTAAFVRRAPSNGGARGLPGAVARRAAPVPPATAPPVPPAAPTPTRAVDSATEITRRKPTVRSRGASTPAPGRTAPEPATVLQQAEALLAEGRVAESCELAERTAARFARDPALHRFLGKCLMRTGRTEQARSHYRTYLELSPDAADAQFIRGILR